MAILTYRFPFVPEIVRPRKARRRFGFADLYYYLNSERLALRPLDEDTVMVMDLGCDDSRKQNTMATEALAMSKPSQPILWEAIITGRALICSPYELDTTTLEYLAEAGSVYYDRP